MTLRCLSSFIADNKLVLLTQLNSATMQTLWETNRDGYLYYNNTQNPPLPPSDYVTSYGTDIAKDFFSSDWISSGVLNYTIDNTDGSYLFKEYNTQIGPRNIVGLYPYNSGGYNIYIRYPESEVGFYSLDYSIVVDDDTQKAIIIQHTRRYDPNGSVTPFERLEIYTAETLRDTYYQAFFGVEPSQYNWVSVQSLTGQGITIPLSTSTDTNNGEAITTSDTTKFALTAESNINKLIVDRLARGN